MTIMQEGLIHKVMNLFVGVDLQFDEDNISSYLSELPIIEHLIYMDISAEKAIERIGSRHTRSRNLSLQSKKDFFKLANKVYSFVLDFLSHKGTKIHIIDNTGNKDKALKSLKTSLNTLIN